MIDTILLAIIAAGVLDHRGRLAKMETTVERIADRIGAEPASATEAIFGGSD